MDDDPVIVTSDLSQEYEIDGYHFDIQIYRLDEETTWTLEVVDKEGTSHRWDDAFVSGFAAVVAAKKAIGTAGPRAFIAGEDDPTLHRAPLFSP